MKRSRKIKGSRKTQRINSRFIAAVLILIISFFISVRIWRGVSKSEIFQIKRVKIKGDPGWLEQSVRFLIGDNLLDVDLDKAQNLLKAQHAEIEKVFISKLWPDTLYVRFRLRQPLAIVGEGEDLLVDRQGWLLSREKYKGEIINLPSIRGISARRLIRKERLNLDEEMLAAFAIIELFSPASVFADFRLIRIDARRVSKCSFLILKDGAEENNKILVKIGEGGYKDKFKMLEIFLKEAKLNWANVNYIDLRFKEPIVGLKK